MGVVVHAKTYSNKVSLPESSFYHHTHFPTHYCLAERGAFVESIARQTEPEYGNGLQYNLLHSILTDIPIIQSILQYSVFFDTTKSLT